MIPTIHICGRCEPMVPSLVDEGFAAGQICQPQNDLVGLQKAVGDKLAFIGGYDMNGELAYVDATEDQIRQSVRDTIDRYAPGGNYGFFGLFIMNDTNEVFRRMAIINDEVIKYGTNYYGK